MKLSAWIVVLLVTFTASARAELSVPNEVKRVHRRSLGLSIAGSLLVSSGAAMQLSGAGLFVSGLGCEEGACRDDHRPVILIDSLLIGVGSALFVAGAVMLGFASAEGKHLKKLRALPAGTVLSLAF